MPDMSNEFAEEEKDDCDKAKVAGTRFGGVGKPEKLENTTATKVPPDATLPSTYWEGVTNVGSSNILALTHLTTPPRGREITDRSDASCPEVKNAERASSDQTPENGAPITETQDNEKTKPTVELCPTMTVEFAVTSGENSIKKRAVRSRDEPAEAAILQQIPTAGAEDSTTAPTAKFSVAAGTNDTATATVNVSSSMKVAPTSPLILLSSQSAICLSPLPSSSSSSSSPSSPFPSSPSSLPLLSSSSPSSSAVVKPNEIVFESMDSSDSPIFRFSSGSGGGLKIETTTTGGGYSEREDVDLHASELPALGKERTVPKRTTKKFTATLSDVQATKEPLIKTGHGDKGTKFGMAVRESLKRSANNSNHLSLNPGAEGANIRTAEALMLARMSTETSDVGVAGDEKSKATTAARGIETVTEKWRGPIMREGTSSKHDTQTEVKSKGEITWTVRASIIQTEEAQGAAAGQLSGRASDAAGEKVPDTVINETTDQVTNATTTETNSGAEGDVTGVAVNKAPDVSTKDAADREAATTDAAAIGKTTAAVNEVADVATDETPNATTNRTTSDPSRDSTTAVINGTTDVAPKAVTYGTAGKTEEAAKDAVALPATGAPAEATKNGAINEPLSARTKEVFTAAAQYVVNRVAQEAMQVATEVAMSATIKKVVEKEAKRATNAIAKAKSYAAVMDATETTHGATDGVADTQSHVTAMHATETTATDPADATTDAAPEASTNKTKNKATENAVYQLRKRATDARTDETPKAVATNAPKTTSKQRAGDATDEVEGQATAEAETPVEAAMAEIYAAKNVATSGRKGYEVTPNSVAEKISDASTRILPLISMSPSVKSTTEETETRMSHEKDETKSDGRKCGFTNRSTNYVAGTATTATRRTMGTVAKAVAEALMMEASDAPTTDVPEISGKGATNATTKGATRAIAKASGSQPIGVAVKECLREAANLTPATLAQETDVEANEASNRRANEAVAGATKDGTDADAKKARGKASNKAPHAFEEKLSLEEAAKPVSDAEAEVENITRRTAGVALATVDTVDATGQAIAQEAPTRTPKEATCTAKNVETAASETSRVTIERTTGVRNEYANVAPKKALRKAAKHAAETAANASPDAGGSAVMEAQVSAEEETAIDEATTKIRISAATKKAPTDAEAATRKKISDTAQTTEATREEASDIAARESLERTTPVEPDAVADVYIAGAPKQVLDTIIEARPGKATETTSRRAKSGKKASGGAVDAPVETLDDITVQSMADTEVAIEAAVIKLERAAALKMTTSEENANKPGSNSLAGKMDGKVPMSLTSSLALEPSSEKSTKASEKKTAEAKEEVKVEDRKWILIYSSENHQNTSDILSPVKGPTTVGSLGELRYPESGEISGGNISIKASPENHCEKVETGVEQTRVRAVVQEDELKNEAKVRFERIEETSRKQNNANTSQMSTKSDAQRIDINGNKSTSMQTSVEMILEATASGVEKVGNSISVAKSNSAKESNEKKTADKIGEQTIIKITEATDAPDTRDTADSTDLQASTCINETITEPQTTNAEETTANTAFEFFASVSEESMMERSSKPHRSFEREGTEGIKVEGIKLNGEKSRPLQLTESVGCNKESERNDLTGGNGVNGITKQGPNFSFPKNSGTSNFGENVESNCDLRREREMVEREGAQLKRLLEGRIDSRFPSHKKQPKRWQEAVSDEGWDQKEAGAKTDGRFYRMLLTKQNDPRYKDLEDYAQSETKMKNESQSQPCHHHHEITQEQQPHKQTGQRLDSRRGHQEQSTQAHQEHDQQYRLDEHQYQQPKQQEQHHYDQNENYQNREAHHHDDAYQQHRGYNQHQQHEEYDKLHLYAPHLLYHKPAQTQQHDQHWQHKRNHQEQEERQQHLRHQWNQHNREDISERLPRHVQRRRRQRMQQGGQRCDPKNWRNRIVENHVEENSVNDCCETEEPNPDNSNTNNYNYNNNTRDTYRNIIHDDSNNKLASQSRIDARTVSLQQRQQLRRQQMQEEECHWRKPRLHRRQQQRHEEQQVQQEEDVHRRKDLIKDSEVISSSLDDPLITASKEERRRSKNEGGNETITNSVDARESTNTPTTPNLRERRRSVVSERTLTIEATVAQKELRKAKDAFVATDYSTKTVSLELMEAEMEAKRLVQVKSMAEVEKVEAVPLYNDAIKHTNNIIDEKQTMEDKNDEEMNGIDNKAEVMYLVVAEEAAIKEIERTKKKFALNFYSEENSTFCFDYNYKMYINNLSMYDNYDDNNNDHMCDTNISTNTSNTPASPSLPAHLEGVNADVYRTTVAPLSPLSFMMQVAKIEKEKYMNAVDDEIKAIELFQYKTQIADDAEDKAQMAKENYGALRAVAIAAREEAVDAVDEAKYLYSIIHEDRNNISDKLNGGARVDTTLAIEDAEKKRQFAIVQSNILKDKIDEETDAIEAAARAVKEATDASELAEVAGYDVEEATAVFIQEKSKEKEARSLANAANLDLAYSIKNEQRAMEDETEAKNFLNRMKIDEKTALKKYNIAARKEGRFLAAAAAARHLVSTISKNEANKKIEENNIRQQITEKENEATHLNGNAIKMKKEYLLKKAEEEESKEVASKLLLKAAEDKYTLSLKLVEDISVCNDTKKMKQDELDANNNVIKIRREAIDLSWAYAETCKRAKIMNIIATHAIGDADSAERALKATEEEIKEIMLYEGNIKNELIKMNEYAHAVNELRFSIDTEIDKLNNAIFFSKEIEEKSNIDYLAALTKLDALNNYAAAAAHFLVALKEEEEANNNKIESEKNELKLLRKHINYSSFIDDNIWNDKSSDYCNDINMNISIGGSSSEDKDSHTGDHDNNNNNSDETNNGNSDDNNNNNVATISSDGKNKENNSKNDSSIRLTNEAKRKIIEAAILIAKENIDEKVKEAAAEVEKAMQEVAEAVEMENEAIKNAADAEKEADEADAAAAAATIAVGLAAKCERAAHATTGDFSVEDEGDICSSCDDDDHSYYSDHNDDDDNDRYDNNIHDGDKNRHRILRQNRKKKNYRKLNDKTNNGISAFPSILLDSQWLALSGAAVGGERYVCVLQRCHIYYRRLWRFLRSVTLAASSASVPLGFEGQEGKIYQWSPSSRGGGGGGLSMTYCPEKRSLKLEDWDTEAEARAVMMTEINGENEGRLENTNYVVELLGCTGISCVVCFAIPKLNKRGESNAIWRRCCVCYFVVPMDGDYEDERENESNLCKIKDDGKNGEVRIPSKTKKNINKNTKSINMDNGSADQKDKREYAYIHKHEKKLEWLKQQRHNDRHIVSSPTSLRREEHGEGKSVIMSHLQIQDAIRRRKEKRLRKGNDYQRSSMETLKESSNSTNFSETAKDKNDIDFNQNDENKCEKNIRNKNNSNGNDANDKNADVNANKIIEGKNKKKQDTTQSTKTKENNKVDSNNVNTNNNTSCASGASTSSSSLSSTSSSSSSSKSSSSPSVSRMYTCVSTAGQSVTTDFFPSQVSTFLSEASKPSAIKSRPTVLHPPHFLQECTSDILPIGEIETPTRAPKLASNSSGGWFWREMAFVGEDPCNEDVVFFAALPQHPMGIIRFCFFSSLLSNTVDLPSSPSCKEREEGRCCLTPELWGQAPPSEWREAIVKIEEKKKIEELEEEKKKINNYIIEINSDLNDDDDEKRKKKKSQKQRKQKQKGNRVQQQQQKQKEQRYDDSDICYNDNKGNNDNMNNKDENANDSDIDIDEYSYEEYTRLEINRMKDWWDESEILEIQMRKDQEEGKKINDENENQNRITRKSQKKQKRRKMKQQLLTKNQKQQLTILQQKQQRQQQRQQQLHQSDGDIEDDVDESSEDNDDKKQRKSWKEEKRQEKIKALLIKKQIEHKECFYSIPPGSKIITVRDGMSKIGDHVTTIGICIRLSRTLRLSPCWKNAKIIYQRSSDANFVSKTINTKGDLWEVWIPDERSIRFFIMNGCGEMIPPAEDSELSIGFSGIYELEFDSTISEIIMATEEDPEDRQNHKNFVLRGAKHLQPFMSPPDSGQMNPSKNYAHAPPPPPI